MKLWTCCNSLIRLRKGVLALIFGNILTVNLIDKMSSMQVERFSHDNLSRDCCVDIDGFQEVVNKKKKKDKSQKGSRFNSPQTKRVGFKESEKPRKKVLSQEEKEVRAAAERSQDARRNYIRHTGILKKSNVKGSQSFVEDLMRNVTDAEETVRQIVFACNQKCPEERAKILDELMRYHVADVIEHPQIVEMINNTRPQDGYTYFHWLMFPSKNLKGRFNIDNFLRCITVLHQCGYSPFAKNNKGETCIDSLMYSVGKNSIPKEYVDKIRIHMLCVPKAMRRNIMIGCLNKMTLNKVDQFSSLLAWSICDNDSSDIANICNDEYVPRFTNINVDDLVYSFVCRCLKVNSSSKNNGHYGSIDILHQAIMSALKMGPKPYDKDTREYFRVFDWTGPEAVSKFFYGVLDFVSRISRDRFYVSTDEDLIDDNGKSISAVIPEVHDGNVTYLLNKDIASPDAVGAIVGEIGDIPHVDSFVETELMEGRIMNAVTCIAHGGLITKRIVNAILTNIGKMSSGSKVFLELALSHVIGFTVRCDQLCNFEFGSNGILIKSSAFFAVANHQNVKEDDYDDIIDDSAYVPPFDINDVDKFNVFTGLRDVKITDISISESGEIYPPRIDDAVYSLERKLQATTSMYPITAIIANIVENESGINLEVAKFIIEACKIRKHLIHEAIEDIVSIPEKEFSTCFDNVTFAKSNLNELKRLFGYKEYQDLSTDRTSDMCVEVISNEQIGAPDTFSSVDDDSSTSPVDDNSKKRTRRSKKHKGKKKK